MESGFTSWERAGVRGVARRGANRQNQTLSPAILVRAGTSTGAIPPTSSIEAPRGLADVARLRVQSRRRDTSCSGPSVPDLQFQVTHVGHNLRTPLNTA